MATSNYQDALNRVNTHSATSGRPPNPMARTLDGSSDTPIPIGSANSGGVTDYNQISQQFQNWNPTSDWGKTMQSTYMMNTLQSYNDMQQAQSMAFTNAGIQMDMMTATAALELANKGALLNAEQQAALNMMGAQFDFESRFAQDDYNRDVGKATLQTDLQVQLMQAQGDQTRANAQVQGFENRMGLQEQGNQTRLTQAQANIETQQQVDQAAELTRISDSHRDKISQDQAKLGSSLRVDEAKVGSGLRQDESKLGSQLRTGEARVGSELRKDEAGYGSGLRKDEARLGSELNIGEAKAGSLLRKDEAGYGSDLRVRESKVDSTLRREESKLGSNLRKDEADFANRLEARTRADQSKRSTSRARGF